MKILTVEQIRECDKQTIDNEPVLPIGLMERAAKQLFKKISTLYNTSTPFTIFAGSGNNGGDALALARMLLLKDYNNIRVILVTDSAKTSDCFNINLNKLNNLNRHLIEKFGFNNTMPNFKNNEVVIDGIFGSGLTRPVTGNIAGLINHINKHASTIISIDVPSGLFADNNTNNNGAIIKATHTLCFELPKLAFFFAENHQYVGNWHVLPIGLNSNYINNAATNYFYTKYEQVLQIIKPRSKFDHKGTFGHGFLVAGSYQKTGAAILAARAALRSGIGLLTVHVPQTAYAIIQTAVPEAIACIDETETDYCKPQNLEKYNALAIGPGIGLKTSMVGAFETILKNIKCPLVIDADAINILSQNNNLWQVIPQNTILTPHPGEFDRLTKKHITSFSRLKTQIELSVKYKVIIVLKGCYTSVTNTNGNVYFNPTGNPGMATAGSGDVLTGIILSLLAQGYKPFDAALAGTYLHGSAGDYAKQQFGHEGLIASDIINNLPLAFKTIKNN